MLKKTSGIVLSHIKYQETSIIVRIFTRDLGLKAYLVNGVRSMSKGSKIALYQPLTLDDPKTSLAHFPLFFLLENAKHLGFAPEEAEGFLVESLHHPFSSEEINLVLPYLKNLQDQGYHPTSSLSYHFGENF